jgi:hypothetical protein
MTRTLSNVAYLTEENSLRLKPSKTEAVFLIGVRRPGQLSIGERDSPAAERAEILGSRAGSANDLLRARPACGHETGKNCGDADAQLGRTHLCQATFADNGHYLCIALGAEIWTGELKYTKDVRILIGAQRRALIRVIAANRTISAEAAKVIAGAPSVDLLATERARLWKEKETGLTRTEARDETETEWQRRKGCLDAGADTTEVDRAGARQRKFPLNSAAFGPRLLLLLPSVSNRRPKR